jgi:hypothetical protein
MANSAQPIAPAPETLDEPLRIRIGGRGVAGTGEIGIWTVIFRSLPGMSPFHPILHVARIGVATEG